MIKAFIVNKIGRYLFPGIFVAIHLFLPVIPSNLSAAEDDIIRLGRLHFERGEYYSAITEMMRYQYLYPNGGKYSQSLLILGSSYFRGGNYYNAACSFNECYEKFKNTPSGEKALLYIGYMRLVHGSPFFAYRTFQEYDYIYKNGWYKAERDLYACNALALSGNLEETLKKIDAVSAGEGDLKYSGELNDLKKQINDEINRPKKSVWVSVLGSIVMPGFGHFYTGNYLAGLFSFITNASLVYLICDGYRDHNRFRMVFFSVVEFLFYEYSIVSAVRNVYQYNSREEFNKKIRLGITERF